MSIWIHVFGRVMLVLAVAILGGGHWIALQAVAWGLMVADGVGTAPLSAVLARTVSGSAPCPMCRAIDEGRKKENQLPALAKAPLKLEASVPEGGVYVRAPGFSSGDFPRLVDEKAPSRPRSPAVPVPIIAG